MTRKTRARRPTLAPFLPPRYISGKTPPWGGVFISPPRDHGVMDFLTYPQTFGQGA
jgi:hypothetical protein